MRVLAGHINPIPEITLRRALPGRSEQRDEVIAFGAYHPHPMYTPGMTWNELRAICPPGWEPEIYIHWSPEYNTLPMGIENAPCLTVGVFGDWNLGGQAMRAIADVFDVVCADRNGCSLLHRVGCETVRHGYLWAYRPEQHRRIPESARDIDILMIGNFNHGVQRERARWLARVAQLSRKYRVIVTGGIYDEEYVRLMNRAKIVFNRSIRGEMNMRAYEAPACGALLFYERENAEVRDFYTDREHCVLYSEDDLETLLDYYLAPAQTAERERIAQNGWQRVQEHTYAHHFARLLNDLEPLAAEKRAGRIFSGPTRFRALPPREQQSRYLFQSILTANQTTLPTLESRASALDALPDSNLNYLFAGDSTGLMNQRGVIFAEWARMSLPHQQQPLWNEAMLALRAAIQQEPDYALARFNLGMICLVQNMGIPCENMFRTAEAQLIAPDLEARQLRGACYPRQFDAFQVDWEETWLEHTPGSDAWRDALRAHLLGRIYRVLCEMSLSRADFQQAEKFAREGLARSPSSARLIYLLGRIARALGRTEEAIAHYRAAIAQTPFELYIWQELIQLCLDTARAKDALSLLENLFALFAGSPFYASHRAGFEPMVQAARQLEAQLAHPKQMTCLLAFPDWNNPPQWQGIMRAFAAAYRPDEPYLLMLRADPELFPDTAQLLSRVEAFLTREMGYVAPAFPNITLVNQPLTPEDQWKLFQAADAVLTQSALPPALRVLAENMNVPFWTSESLRERRAA